MEDIYQNHIPYTDCIASGNDTLQFPLEYDWYTPVYKIVHDTIGVPMDKTQDEILKLLNDIYVDGVGYNDVVGVVAVPLIIALFAFSFPFVFDRINQINDKYQSKILSTLFSSFLLYKLYWYVSLISIVYVLVYGACTLFCKDNVLGDYAVIWNGISLSVVIVYVLIVWFFARITVKYNDPEQLLGILDTQYKYERKISDIKVWRLKAKAFFRYSRHRKDVEGNSAFISAKNMVSKWKEKMPEEKYLYRINEIARYAIKQDKEVTIQNLYKMTLDDNILVDFKQRFDQFDNDIARYIPQGLFADKPENKVEKELVNPCQLLVHKLLFLDFTLYSFGRNIYYDFVEIMSNRIMYLALCAFRKMKMREKTLVYPNFDLFFEEFTRGKVEDYVLIGIESPFHAVLNIRYVGYKVFYRQIVPYIEIDAVGARNKLNDLDNYEYFKNSLLIVNKSDLPAIANSSNENVTIDFKEETDELKMKMNVRTTVDVHKELRFNKTAEIAVVRLK